MTRTVLAIVEVRVTRPICTKDEERKDESSSKEDGVAELDEDEVGTLSCTALVGSVGDGAVVAIDL